MQKCPKILRGQRWPVIIVRRGLFLHIPTNTSVLQPHTAVAQTPKSSPSGNRTLVSRVTGGDTDHYTNEDRRNVYKILFEESIEKLPKWTVAWRTIYQLSTQPWATIDTRETPSAPNRFQLIAIRAGNLQGLSMETHFRDRKTACVWTSFFWRQKKLSEKFNIKCQIIPNLYKGSAL